MAAIEFASRGIQEQLEAMVTRSRNTASYLNRTFYKKYQAAQMERWQTENASQGGTWRPLNKKYAARKLKKYASYPGKGTKMLIGTTALAKSVIGPGGDGVLSGASPNHYKIVTDHSIEIGTTLNYAPFVGAVRPIMEFKPEWWSDVYRGLAQFLAKGLL